MTSTPERIEFAGTDQEVLDFVGREEFDYETDYTNASVNVKLTGSHGRANVPLGYHFYKTEDGLSIVSDDLDSYIKVLEAVVKHGPYKQDEQLKLENIKLRGLLARIIDEVDVYVKDSPLDKLIKEAEEVLNDRA